MYNCTYCLINFKDSNALVTHIAETYAQATNKNDCESNSDEYDKHVYCYLSQP